MIVITEQNLLNNIQYLIEVFNGDELTNSYTIRCKSAVVSKNDKLYYVLYDRDFSIISPVFSYINTYMDAKGLSPQTKDKTLVALKLLYSFMAIFNITLEAFSQDDAARFVAFLSGRSVNGSDITLNAFSQRTDSSINDYLGLIRSYLYYMKLDSHPLCRKTGQKTITNVLGETSTTTAYALKAREYHKTAVPKHIKLDEYLKMRKYLYDTGDLKLECIIRLMYESGLRVGEVLSLTFEDVKMEEKNGMMFYKVILRNRYGNPKDRSPKFLMKIKDRNDYKSKAYLQKGYGWNEMMISRSLYDMLLDYINEAHEKAMEKYPERWDRAHADSVDSDYDEDENFFIFLNKRGSPLSSKTLESEVKELFIKCGVPVNMDGGRYDGLCHRFRHGFAMYQINHNRIHMALLKELMRHNSINSTAVYYTPENSDIVKIKDDLSMSIYELIPDFEISKEN